MALSYQEAILPAGTTSVVITIPYMQESDLIVELNDVPTSAYTIQKTTPETLVFDTPIAANGTKFMLVRETDATDLFQKFAKGSQFTPANLDSLHYQLLWLAQEVKERGRNVAFDNLDMKGYRIVGMGKHIDPTDAMQWQEFIDHLAQCRYVPDIPEDTPREKTFARGKKGWIEIAGDGGIPDAPDTQFYVRTKGAWVLTADPANATPDVPVDQTGMFLRQRVDEVEAKWVQYTPPEPPTPPAITDDAPADGKTYGRKNGAWSEASGGGGGGDTPLPATAAVGDACVKTKTGAGAEVWAPLGTAPAEFNQLNTYGIAASKNGSPVGVTLAEGMGVDTRAAAPIWPCSNWMDKAVKFSTFEYPVTDDSNPTPITFDFAGLQHTTALDRKYLVDLVIIKGPDGRVMAGNVFQVLFGSNGTSLYVRQNGNQVEMSLDGSTFVGIKPANVRVIIDYEAKTISAYQMDMNGNIVPDTTITYTATYTMDRATTKFRFLPYFKYQMWGSEYEGGAHLCIRRIVFGNYFYGVRPNTMCSNKLNSTARLSEVFTNIPSANINWSLWSPYDRVRGQSGFDNLTDCTEPNMFAHMLIDGTTYIDGHMGAVSAGVEIDMNPYVSIPDDNIASKEEWEQKKRIHHLRRGRDWVPFDIPPEGFAPNATTLIPSMRTENEYVALGNLSKTYAFDKKECACTHYLPVQDRSDYVINSLVIGATNTLYLCSPEGISYMDISMWFNATAGGDQSIVWENLKPVRISNVYPTSTDGHDYVGGKTFAIRTIVRSSTDWEVHIMHQTSDTDQTMVVGAVFKMTEATPLPLTGAYMKYTKSGSNYTCTGVQAVDDSLRGLEYVADKKLNIMSSAPILTGKVVDGYDLRTTTWGETAPQTYNLSVLAKEYNTWVGATPCTAPSVREYGDATSEQKNPMVWSPSAGTFVPILGLTPVLEDWYLNTNEGRSWDVRASNPMVICGWEWAGRSGLLIDPQGLPDGRTVTIFETYESTNLTLPRAKVNCTRSGTTYTFEVINCEVMHSHGVMEVTLAAGELFGLIIAPYTDARGASTAFTIVDKVGAITGAVRVNQLLTTETVGVINPLDGNLKVYSVNSSNRYCCPQDNAGAVKTTGMYIEHSRGVAVQFPNGVYGTCPTSSAVSLKLAQQVVTGYRLTAV